jgi:hypothetical protein
MNFEKDLRFDILTAVTMKTTLRMQCCVLRYKFSDILGESAASICRCASNVGKSVYRCRNEGGRAKLFDEASRR